MTLEQRQIGPLASASLLDVLDRVLDKGLVVAGDIRISLANVELLTIQIRLLVCSVDKAEEIGLDWWRGDPFLSSRAGVGAEDLQTLRARIEALERHLGPARGSGKAEKPADRVKGEGDHGR